MAGHLAPPGHEGCERDEHVSQPPRIAAVGAGKHASAAILPSLAPAGLTLGAICGRTLTRVESAARRFGGVPAFTDVERMLEDTKPDGVVVVVPPDQYAPVIRSCIRHQVPVFAEKPGANDADEATAVAAEAAAAGVPLMVGYMKRFAGAYQRARQVSLAPEFGPLTLGSFMWSMGPTADRFDLRTWILENPVHHFDLARFFFGELHEVHVCRAGGSEHTIVVTAESQSGAVISIRATTTGSWEQRNEAVELFGEGHSLIVENLDTCIWRPPQRPELVWKPNYTMPSPRNMTGATMGFVTELEHFHHMIVDGIECASDMVSAAATLKLATSIADRVRIAS